jgi:hypothetical protein
MSERKCDYPGCSRPATITCGAIGCSHKVCDIHGNCGVETDSDHPPIEVCWGCGGKCWGDTFPPPLKDNPLELPSTGWYKSSSIIWKEAEPNYE